MTAEAIANPLPIFIGLNGQPMTGGSVYFGVAGEDARTSPVDVFWDEAMTIPAQQPVLTHSGYLYRNGAPARIWCASDYSILALDSTGRQVYYIGAARSSLRTDLAASSGSSLVGFMLSGIGAVARTLDERGADVYNVKDFGATPGTTTDQSAFFASAFAAALVAGVGVVEAEGTYYFTSDLVLFDGVALRGRSRASLVLRMDGCTVTNEVLSNSNPSCRNTGLRATIESVNGTELVGLDLKGVQYSDFDVKISGFSSASSIGLRCTSVLDPGAGAYRYTTNNTFHDIEVTGCYKGVHLTKNPLDGATFGSNFNLFLQGYINGYTSIGVHLEYGEAVSFYGTRCTTSIGAGSIGWKIQDSICRLIGCTADGSFGGTVPGTLDAWGFPHGRDGDLTTTGFYFTAGASGAVVISSGGDACYKRFDFDSQTTLDNIQIMGRVSYNWFPDLMVKQLTALSDAAATACQTLHNRVAGSSTVLAQYKNGSSVNNGLLRMLSNGAIEFGSGDSDTKLLAGNAVAWRAAATTLAWQPEGDNTQSLGTSTKRASVVYAGTGTINTSDEREKQQVRTLSDAERAVAVRVKGLIRAFKFNDAVEKKGDGARVHFGVIAQDVIAAFQAEGLDPFAYAMVCYDEWPDTYEPGDDGEPVLVTPAGSRYGIRYEELLAFVLGAM